MPGYTLTLYHIILANCSTPKPVSIVRFSEGSQLVINDTFMLPAAGLCLAVDQQLGDTLHKVRPPGVAGVQSVDRGQPNTWCARDAGTNRTNKGPSPIAPIDVTSSPSDNSSYSEIEVAIEAVKLFANTTGFGPPYAATLSDPAAKPYYVHSTWPATGLCSQEAAILNDIAVLDPHGWVDGAAVSNASSAASQPGSGSGSYGGTFLVHYVDSAWLCPQPLSVAECADVRDPNGCLVAAYDRANPDNLLVPGAAAYRLQQEAARRSYGTRVVLPAVLCSVGELTCS